MSKIKKLISLLAATTLCFGMCALTACGGDDSSTPSVSNTESSDTGSNEEISDAYVIYVKNSDGTPATNVRVQLCKGLEFCLGQLPELVDENGKVVIKPSDSELNGVACGADEYDIHIWSGDMTNELEYEETDKKTPATYGEITLTIAD
ncbi:MAG: hypothetical protein IJX91_05805 [Clostridia bacterium]|nr:hypothetical protein [Clostridia bacterium]